MRDPGFIKRVDWPNHSMAFISTLLGVWLAFYLGNYNEYKRDRTRKEVAMASIREEIQNNNDKAKRHMAELDSLVGAISKFSSLVNDDLDLIATEQQMANFLEDYGWFLIVENKHPVRDSLYEYDGNLNLNLQLSNLSDIAWENTKLMDVLHLIDTKKAFSLHGLYRLQEEAQETVTESVDIIKSLYQKNNDSDAVTRTIMNDLKGQLQFAYGMQKALQANYDAFLEKYPE